MSVLYITQNGVADHIGQSQVAPYVLGLAREGHRIHLLSAEKPGQEEIIGRYQRLFDAAGVTWTRVRYHSAPKVFGPLWTQWQLERAARQIVTAEGIHAVHCRSYPAALIGRRLKRRFAVKYLYDFRDFYADGGLTKAPKLLRPLYGRMKQLEGPMIRDADRIVCLTNRARNLLIDWYLAGEPDASDRFQIIPCCADFAHFDPDNIDATTLSDLRLRLGLKKDQAVLLYLGSLGPDYLLPQMMDLFAQLVALRGDARFLFVSNNGRELVEVQCAAKGIEPDRVLFTSAERADVPAHIALATLSVVFIRADQSKAGCSPTKLAELFAMNVPVIADCGVGDIDAIISPERNGSALVADFAPTSLRQAIVKVLEMQKKGDIDIRRNSAEFDLPQGIAAYAKVYRELEGA